MKSLQRTCVTLVTVAAFWMVCSTWGQARLAAAELEQSESTNAAVENTQEETSPPAESPGSESRRGGRVERAPVVMFGQAVVLKTNETAEAVVVIGGSVKVHGKVREAVVVVGGDVEVTGEVGEAVVAVMGSVRVRPTAVIDGDVVSVGGRLEVEEGATIKGHVQEVAVAGMRLPSADWIHDWLRECVSMLRPLSPRVGWVWFVALLYFLIFLFIAAVFRRPVQTCVDELTERPATTFVMGLLTKLLLPLIVLILLILVVGIVVVPFLLAAVVLLGLVGKVAVLEWIGFSVARAFRKEQPLIHPVLALVIGAGVLAVLYMIPVVGLLAMLLLSVWSLGCAITAAFGGFRRELPSRTPPPPQSTFTPTMESTIPSSAASGMPPSATTYAAQPFSASAEASTASAPFATGGPAPAATATPVAGEPPVMPDVLVYPKASFWERIGAAFLDTVLVIILGSLVGHFGLTLIIGLAYVTGMWTWRGTTIGGIVLGLKVVRMNGEPPSFAVSLVRGLSAGFSAIVLFLGFFWIAWDAEKQAWHDKIAGTYVLKLPRGTPLLCL